MATRTEGSGDREKVAVRRRLSLTRARLSARVRHRKSLAIQRRVLALPEFKRAPAVVLYHSVSPEVETTGMIDAALACGKAVYLPRTSGRKRLMEMCRVRSREKDLCVGVYGICQPHADLDACRRFSRKTIVIVPGVGFSVRGERLGRGAGFYDAFLGAYPRLKRIGVLFEEQLVREVPVAAHDMPMDLVVTDTRIIRAGRKNNE